jgi:uncharacterized membrane protein
MRGLWFMTRWRYRRRRLWLAPALIVVTAIVLSRLLPAVDMALADEERSSKVALLRHFDAAAFASLLSAVASGMIAFTGFVFTAVTLALQFGTSTFSARLIPFFQRDRVIRASLGVFLATFVYSLLIAGRLGARTEDYKPIISSLFALFLALASVALFIALVQRIMDLLRVVRLLRRVARKGGKAVAAAYPYRHDDPSAGPEEGFADEPDEPSATIRHRGAPGVILAFDLRRLSRLAVAWDVRFVLLAAIGDFVTRGNPIIEIHGDAKRPRRRALRRCLIVAEERSLDHDPAFALRVIADVALKALSPAVNDPTTAVQALDYVEDLLIRIGYNHLGSGLVRDDHRVVRVRFRAPTWEDHVAIGIDEIRHYGSDSIQVLRRLRALLDAVQKATPPIRHPALHARLAALDEAVEGAFGGELDRALARVPDAQGLGSGGRALGSGSP